MFDRVKFIDLSQTLSPGIPLASILPRMSSWTYLDQRLGDPVNCQALLLSEHTGTHCDAPAHIFPGRAAVDALPADAYSGPGICLDVSHRAEGQGITADDVAEAEARCPRRITKGDVVLLYTGHARRWDTLPLGAAYLKGRPWVSVEAATFLIDRGVKAVGIDFGGPDPLGSELVIHKLLLDRGVWIVESLTNLEKLLGKDFYFLCLPLKIAGGTGSPVRAVALVRESE